jgi:hypothetical protein
VIRFIAKDDKIRHYPAANLTFEEPRSRQGYVLIRFTVAPGWNTSGAPVGRPGSCYVDKITDTFVRKSAAPPTDLVVPDIQIPVPDTVQELTDLVHTHGEVEIWHRGHNPNRLYHKTINKIHRPNHETGHFYYSREGFGSANTGHTFIQRVEGIFVL